jgi:hypothetical protein
MREDIVSEVYINTERDSEPCEYEHNKVWKTYICAWFIPGRRDIHVNQKMCGGIDNAEKVREARLK